MPKDSRCDVRSDDRFVPLLTSAAASEGGSVTTLQAVLDAGATVDCKSDQGNYWAARDTSGNTPLHELSSLGDEWLLCAATLLAKSVDPETYINFSNVAGENALDIAVEMGPLAGKSTHDSLISWLLQHGAVSVARSAEEIQELLQSNSSSSSYVQARRDAAERRREERLGKERESNPLYAYINVDVNEANKEEKTKLAKWRSEKIEKIRKAEKEVEEAEEFKKRIWLESSQIRKKVDEKDKGSPEDVGTATATDGFLIHTDGGMSPTRDDIMRNAKKAVRNMKKRGSVVKEQFSTARKDCMPNLLRAMHYLSNARTPKSDKGWYYVDETGQIRGNFTSEGMRSWYEQGLLAPTLLVRNGIIAENFNRIDELWKIGVEQPFVESGLDDELEQLQRRFARLQNALA